MAGRPIPSDLKKQMNKAVVQKTDMDSEKATEVIDIISGAIDKNSLATGVNQEAACRAIKEHLDKQYGALWHCTMGEGFAFDVTAQDGTLMYCFYQGSLAVLCFKC
uniref:Dynein light chain n=1 Tax=Chromera velia CCMP2878 TaxID=1169474 RepID=A0A0G4IDC7_9ALVE|mmetsp:Transcript_44248/g.87296  ORF Transcript_44248/g.87296 Transcript_44248/m.87296 type:complete len:106 (+) Transcript_44248:311-628(+)|eukprot:Cvel_13310.t1-p1 / transcript=Cvel_13310.t1 / gene=Cvel_13310 / organism=Chromera_velia_CCMP2878 / gene_product=Dynein light chain 4, axonemal, putative / transcript_product=Dynein light chain 4, axonemal, putative / location=Cvel_scaffold903:37799-39895(-) / protein_length=105 / sequence_SO=supercontig / SO=protein_coding / is_pseudo=false